MPFQLLSVFHFYFHLLLCLHWDIPGSVLASFSIFPHPCSFELSSNPVTLNGLYIWTILKFISLAPDLISTLQIPKFGYTSECLVSHRFTLFILSLLSVNDSSAPKPCGNRWLFSISLILYHSTSKDAMCIPSEFISRSPYFLCLTCSKLAFLWISCYFSKWFPRFILFCVVGDEYSVIHASLKLSSQEWPWISDPPTSTSARFTVYTTILSIKGSTPKASIPSTS